MKAEDNKFPYLTLTERESVPAIPDAGTARVFVDVDGRPQFIDDAGVVTEIGADGVGVPPGGTTAQILAKLSDADFDTAWVVQATGTGVPIVYIPAGGTAADVPPGTPNDALIIERG